jgi:hypothetical protein
MMDFPLAFHFFVAFIGTLGFCLLFTSLCGILLMPQAAVAWDGLLMCI